MSLRLEMLQVARLAPKLLGESAELVESFVRRQIAADGGFRGRGDASDLYYTVFGLECLHALRAEVPADAVAAYLEPLADGGDLDLVHLSCLARCWAALPDRDPPDALRRRTLERLPAFRSGDGGFQNTPGRPNGTIYGCFLALGICQDLGARFPATTEIAAFVDSMGTPDGGYANERSLPEGSTPATAAAVALLRHLDRPAPGGAGSWLAARCRPGGGFLATPRAPMPDLLSTATALHALAGLEVPIEPFREPCLDYVDSLWTNEGSFYGHWAETELDCEYTFYGLLALGHLAL